MNASGRLLARLTVLGVLGAFGMTAGLPVHADDASPESSQKSAATELAALHEAPWDRRGDFILSLKSSLEALSELPEDAPAAHSCAEGGSRTGWFGEAWTDVDGDGCDTRNEILARDLTDADFSRADGIQSRGEGSGRGAGTPAADKTEPMEAQHKEDMPDPAAVFSASWACEALNEDYFEVFLSDTLEWREEDGDRNDPETYAAVRARAIAEMYRNAEVGPVEIQEIGQFPHGSYLAAGDPFGEMCLCALRIDPGVARAPRRRPEQAGPPASSHRSPTAPPSPVSHHVFPPPPPMRRNHS